MTSDRKTMDPTALPIVEAARLFTKLGARSTTVAMLEADIAAGAPTNADGTINLVRYAAWLAKEMGRGE